MSVPPTQAIDIPLDAGRERQIRAGTYQQLLPIGLVRREDGRVVLAPDAQVRHALALVFARFVAFVGAPPIVTNPAYAGRLCLGAAAPDGGVDRDPSRRLPCLHAVGPQGAAIEAAVVTAFFAALQPAELDLLDDVLAAQRADQERLQRQHREQLARAEYEVRLAEKQYLAVTPKLQTHSGPSVAYCPCAVRAAGRPARSPEEVASMLPRPAARPYCRRRPAGRLQWQPVSQRRSRRGGGMVATGVARSVRPVVPPRRVILIGGARRDAAQCLNLAFALLARAALADQPGGRVQGAPVSCAAHASGGDVMTTTGFSARVSTTQQQLQGTIESQLAALTAYAAAHALVI